MGNEWISVQDRLPQERQQCAIVVNGGKNHVYCRWGQYRGDGCWSGDGGFLFYANWPEGLHNVTHWMEVPALPQFDETDHPDPEAHE